MKNGTTVITHGIRAAVSVNLILPIQVDQNTVLVAEMSHKTGGFDFFLTVSCTASRYYMGQIKIHRPVLLIAAVTSRNREGFEWTKGVTARNWGPICLESEIFDFTETSFYAHSMGSDLKKQFVAFENLVDPGEIAQTKIQSNRWESEFAETHSFPEKRPLNIDPGYLTEAKLVLVTTKDRDHRIYLRDGIFAEITLYYHDGSWTKSRWTYRDYQREDFQRFFTKCREYLRAGYRDL